MKRGLAFATLLVVGIWSYMPYVLGFQHLKNFSFNQYNFPALQGILTHPGRRYTFEAVQFINSHCSSQDYVVVPQYDPGLGQLLKCGELFGRDAYIFTRADNYLLSPWETPYAPQGGITNGALIERMIQQTARGSTWLREILKPVRKKAGRRLSLAKALTHAEFVTRNNSWHSVCFMFSNEMVLENSHPLILNYDRLSMG